MTNETKHTPGPWHRNIKPATHYNTIFAERNTHVTRLAVEGKTAEEVEANCALIVAAPDLLAALRAAEEWAEHIEDDENRVPIDVRLAMRDAIAKARGGAA